MADLFWVGDISTDFLDPSNYRTAYGGSSSPSAIATTDSIYFTDMGEADCVLSATATVDALIWEDRYETETIGTGTDTINLNSPNRFAHNFQLDNNLALKDLVLNGPITTSTSGAKITFSGSPRLDNNRKFATMGENASIASNIELFFDPSSSQVFFLDNGQYATVVLANGILRPQYTEPTFNGHDKIEIEHIDIRSTMTIEPDVLGRRDREVYFLFYGTPDPFVCAAPTVDFGRATFAIAGAQGGTPTEIPMNYAVNYGGTSDFSIKYGALRIYSPQATNNPYRASISNGLTLAVNHLIIDEGVHITGGTNCTIECVSLPIIKGSLGNFMQVNDGLYRTSDNAILSDPVQEYRYGGTGLTTLGTSGQVLATKSTLDGMEWITVSGGGGGSGTVTSVGATVPTGFSISGSPITGAGTLAISYAAGYSLPTTAKQGQWDTAYGWGDHASAGYLTSFTETDPVFVAHASYTITTAKITNWDTAYGWGDHSAAGYLTSAITSVSPITLDTSNNRVGINEASPDYDLHVHGSGNYTVKFEHGEGQTLFNQYGHIQIFNDNTSPTDGATLDNPVWSIGQRDTGAFDIALGNISTNFVSATKKLLELKRVGNTESGAGQIGFLGTTAVSQQSATASTNSTSNTTLLPLPPSVDPTFDAELASRMGDIEVALNALETTVASIKTSVDSVITALQAYGLLS